MYVAKFSDNYQLSLQKGSDDAWDGAVIGPMPSRDQRIWLGSDIEEAKLALYEFADRHFQLRGIAEPRIHKDKIDWREL
jgi:hypothetical protein